MKLSGSAYNNVNDLLAKDWKNLLPLCYLLCSVMSSAVVCDDSPLAAAEPELQDNPTNTIIIHLNYVNWRHTNPQPVYFP